MTSPAAIEPSSPDQADPAPIEWVNALSTRPSLEGALTDVCDRALAALSGPPDLALVFISAAFGSEYPRLMPLLYEKLSTPALIGCGGGGIIGQASDGRAIEIEDEPALSLTLARLPGVNVKTFHIAADELPDMDSAPEAWARLVGVDPADRPHFILLADPALAQVNDLIQGLDYAYPGSIKVGGLASGSSFRTNRNLFKDFNLCREGSVGVALSGNITIDPIVAQGCRPIGSPYWVTESDRNIVIAVEQQTDPEAIAGQGKTQPPLFALRELVDSLDEEDRELAQNALFVGVARDAFRQTLEPGDFLIRNLLGVDPNAGAIAIGDRVRTGQRIQFHLRDSTASSRDLESLLERYLRDQNSDQATPIGALMFSCMGRGEGLYGKPNFDSGLLRQYLGKLPIGGFFCNGEIGPVGGSTFVHGYTSVFGLIRRP